MFTKQLEGLLTFNPDTLKYWVGVHHLTSWEEGTSLALIGHPSSDGVMIKISFGVDVLLHQPASHYIFSYWVG